MRKYGIICIALLILVFLLTSCAPKEAQRYQVINAGNNQAPSAPVQAGSVPNAPQQNVSSPSSDIYDPSSEEGVLDDLPDFFEGNSTLSTEPTPVPTMRSSYAGATPVVLDPIDKPTPTPVPLLTFSTFVTYDATNIGVSFSAPEGWTEETGNGSYTIINPDERMDYQARLSIAMSSVTSDYSKSELTKEVKDILGDLKSMYSSFSSTQTADRSLLDKAGVYADFTAVVRETGAHIGGRVHAVSVNKKLYVMTLTWPADYKEVYKDTVYRTFRHSIQVTR